MAGMGIRDMSASGRRQRVFRVSSVTPGNVEAVDVGGVALTVVGGVAGVVEDVTVKGLLMLTEAVLIFTGRLMPELESVRLVPVSLEPDMVGRAVMGALERPTLLVLRLRTGTVSMLAADVARLEFWNWAKKSFGKLYNGRKWH